MKCDLTNRFTLTGKVCECQVEIFDTHIKAKMVIDVDNYAHTVFYFVLKKFNYSEYNKMYMLSDNLLHKFVIVSGNVSQRQTDGSILFYASYVDIVKKYQPQVNFEVEGFIYNNYLINILNDAPRGFQLCKQYTQTNIIYRLKNTQSPITIITNDIIQDITSWKYRISKTNKTMSQADMESYIAEWNIIQKYYG